MADRYGIDLGNVYAKAEAIREARTRNKFLPRSLELEQQGAATGNAMSTLRLGQAQQDVADEATARAARAQGAADAGITGPAAKLLTISPSQASDFTTYLQGLDDKARANVARNIDQLGQAANYIKSAKDPAKAFLEVKSLMPAEVQKKFPATYDPEQVDLWLSQATEMKGLIDSIGGGSGDLTKDAPSGYQWTDPNKSALKPIKGGPKDPDAKGSEGSGVKTAVSNSIRATVATRYGGVYDPDTHEISGLDPAQADRALAIMAEAERLTVDENLPVAQAVQKAVANKGGWGDAGTGNAAAQTGGADSDPLGIRGGG